MTGVAETSEGTALSEEALAEWGGRLGRRALEGRVFVALYGPLGSGKTTLVQAACRGAGVVEPVLSPTFTLIHEYAAGDRTVYHADLYRVDDPEELAQIGWDYLLTADGPVFVEWADRAGAWLPDDRWEIRLAMGDDPETRRVRTSVRGDVPPVPSPEAV